MSLRFNGSFAFKQIAALLLILLLGAPVHAQTNGTAITRHALQINGSIEGSVQQLTGENVSLNGGATLTKDLLVPGTPAVTLNGHPGFGGIVTGTGSPSPSGYQITLNGNATLGNLRTRIDAVALPAISAPAAPNGTRSVVINSAGQSAGNWATVGNLTLNGNVGQYAVPPGTYGDFTANGGSGFTLGTPGSTQPAVYNLQHLSLNGQAQIQVVGPVIINLANGFAANGLLGTSKEPSWLVINIAAGDFSLNGGCKVAGYVWTPAGTITVNGNSTLSGGAACDRLIVNGGGLLQLWPFTGNSGSNQPPVANARNLDLDEDVPLQLVLTGSDPENSALIFTVLTPPAHGTLGGTAPNLTYTPAANYNGPDSFTFKVSDGQLDSAPATVSLTVHPVNDPPVALPQVVSLNEDSPVSVVLTGTDVESDPLSFTVTIPPAHGTLSGTAPNLTYTPGLHYTGTDIFSFKANDGQADSAIATVSLNISPVEHAPTALNLSPQLLEDQSAQITLVGVDADGDPLTYTIVSGPKHGTLNGTPPNLAYTPNPDYNGPDQFTYTAFDGTLTSAPATVSLTVIPVNDPPIANPLPVSTNEDQPVAVTLSGTDVDGDALHFTVATQPAHGTLSGTAPNLVYTPNANYNGTDAFSFFVNDGLVNSGTAAVTLSIAPVNDAPVATPVTLQSQEGSAVPLVLNATDVDGDGLAYFIVQAPTHGTLSGVAPNLVYTPNADFSGTEVFTYKANDGTVDSPVVPVTIEVIRVNHPPVVDAGADQSIQQPYAALLSGSVTDDGLPSTNSLSVAWTKVSGPGEVTFQTPDAAITKANFSVEGTYVLQLLGNDSVLSATDQVTVTVQAQPNEPPRVYAGIDQDLHGSQVALLSGSASDDGLPKGSSLSLQWSKVSGPGSVSFADASQAHTTATFGAPGAYVLQLSANDTQFTRTSSVSITVHPANQPPVVSAGNGQNVALSSGANLLGSVSDDGLPNGGALSVQWSKVSGPGEVAFGSGSQLATTASFSSEGTYVLRLVASDTELSGSSDVVVMVQSPANQAPIVDAGSNQQIQFSSSVLLNGKITDDGLPTGAPVTALWSKVSGPGEVRFDAADSAATGATFSQPGVYVLRLTASDTALSASGDVTITVQTQNEAPQVDAGADQTIALPQTATLQGKVTDDGLPVGAPVTLSWSQVSGTGSVSFENPSSASTKATFSAPGTYVLRLTASDTVASGSDDLTITVQPQPYRNRTYTTTADFAEGKQTNLATPTPDQIQLAETVQLKSCIWVANSGKGTVVKIDTDTGKILGEYWTSPDGQPKNPSRTTVDLNGSVWVTNRDGNSVTQIVTPESGLWVDRNGNGICDTSTGLNDIRPWSNANGADTNGGASTDEDECVIHYTLVHSTGTRHVAVDPDNNVWVSGIGGQNFDLLDGSTGEIIRSEKSVGFGGYGGLIDKNGVIWSSNPLLRWDVSKPLTGPNGGNWKGYPYDSYGLGIDPAGYIWNTSYSEGIVRKYAPDGSLVGSYSHKGVHSKGCAVDKNGDVWIAICDSPGANTVAHLKNDGTYVGAVTVGSNPSGIAVDAKGKIWATNRISQTVSRIDPAAGPIGADGVTHVGQVDFTTPDLGGDLYNYSDMTGSTLFGKPTAGSWAVVYDSGLVGAQWGSIGWNATVVNNAKLNVTVASGTDGTSFGNPVPVTAMGAFSVPNGRYLKVTVNFVRASTGQSPVLYDLTVGTVGAPVTAPNHPPTISAGNDFSIEINKTAPLTATLTDDGLPLAGPRTVLWSQQSGPGVATFANPNAFRTTATFSAPGTYVLRATGSDGEFSDSSTVSVTCVGFPWVYAGPDLVVRDVNIPVTLQGWVPDLVMPPGTTLSTQWSVVGGPGNVSFGDATLPVTTASFSAAGSYVLKLSATGGSLNASDLVEVRVNSASSVQAPAGIVGWWPGNWSVADVVGGHDAIWSGSADYAAGKVSGAFRFDGTNKQLLTSGSLDAGRDGAVSVEFWVNTAAAPNNYFVPLVGWQSGSKNGVIVDQGNNGCIEVHFYDTTGQDHTLSSYYTINLIPGVWTHIACTYDKATGMGYLYWNGVRIGSSYWGAFTPQTTYQFGFGSLANGAGTFSGMLDEISVYNRALTAEEIYNIYSAGGVGKAPDINNAAPVVNAGPDTSCTGTLNLQGTVSDDGLPSGSTLTIQWSKVDGPGTVSFAPSNAASTTATFAAPGVYQLKLTADDGYSQSSDLVEVRVSSSSSVPAPKGIQAWWPGNWNATDVVGGHNGQWTGGADYASGKVSGAFRFDATNKQVLTSGSLDAGRDGALSVEFWMNTNGVPNSYFVPVVGWQSGSKNGVIVDQGNIGSVEVHFYDTNGQDHYLTSYSTINQTPGTWTHVACTYDKATGMGYLYYNGVQIASNYFGSFTPQTTYNFGFGSLPNSAGIFSGMLDEIAVYNRALTAQEIYSIYAAGAVGKAPAGNSAPVVSAGPDQSGSVATAINLQGTVSDDALPTGSTLSIQWSKVSGPGTVNFVNAHSATTQASFSAAGIYVLKLAGDDGLAQASDLVEVRVDTPGQVVPASGLVAWWPGNWTATDIVGGHNGVWSGMPTYDAGKVSGAFSFDGSTREVLIPGTLDAGHNGAVSVEFWVNSQIYNTTGIWSPLFGWHTGNKQWLVINEGQYGDVYVQLTDAVGNLYYGGGVASGLPDRTWTHVAFTYDKATGLANFYLNGVQATSRNLGAFTPQTGYDLSFGSQTFGYQYFRGLLDEVAIYNRALSAAEISAIYSAGAAGKVPPAQINAAPTVHAGAAFTVTQNALATLHGEVGDDGLPAGGALTAQWSLVSGPGQVAFGNAASAITSVQFDQPGTYVLRLTGNDSLLFASDDLTVTVTPVVDPASLVNTAPVVKAGSDLVVPIATGASLVGRVTDDGLPFGHGLAIQWSKTSGPGQVTFSPAGQAVTQAQFSLPGDYVLTLSADDSQKSASSSINVTVLPSHNAAPVVSAGSNGTCALSGTATLAGSASDDGLPLGSSLLVSWHKVSGPGSVTFANPAAAATGATFGAVGTYVLELDADDSEKRASSQVTITVTPAPNTAPVISAGADQSVPFGQYATVSPSLTDDNLPNGVLSVSWAQIAGPAAVQVQSGQGDNLLVTGPKVGDYVLRLTVSDGEFTVSDDVTVTVTAGSLKAPSIQLTSPAAGNTAPQGTLLNVSASASSSNGAIASVEFYADGVKIGERDTGPYAMNWIAPSAGIHTLTAVATDSVALSATATPIQVTTAVTPLAVTLASPSANQLFLSGRNVPISALATGNGIASVTFYADGAPLGSGSTAPYVFSWSNASTGTHTLSATVTDHSGATASSAPVAIEVVQDSPTPPTLELTIPDEGATITAPTQFKGTASSPILKNWRLSYRERAAAGNLDASSLTPNQGWVQFAGGTSNVENDTLGTLDTTLLRNGIYDIELVVTDLGGTSYALDASAVVDGGMKVGAFTLAFNDLQVPLPGVPITVTRTYDSRNSASGDFGFGWSLDVNSVHLDKNQALGDSWYADVQPPPTGNPFEIPVYSIYDTSPHVITVTFPDGKVCRFNAVLKLKSSGAALQRAFIPYTTGDAFFIDFVPQPGTQGQLVARGMPSSLYMEEDGFLCPLRLSTQGGEFEGDFSDANTFDYVSPEGRTYSFDSNGKLIGMNDRNGNTLSFNRDGQGTLNAIAYTNASDSSASRSIAFVRDSQQRITQIVDPNGKSLNYQYNASGDLVAFFDRSKDPQSGPATATYTYAGGSHYPHYLTGIADASGVAAIRNEYDADGRLVKTTDAAGKTIVYTHNIDGRTESITDRSGNTTLHAYDERGNVLATTDPLGNTTRYTYDAHNNKLSETNALGQTTTYAYDAYDRLLSTTDALGHSTVFTYNALSQPLTITDALGHTTTNSYDGAGNLLSTTDALGNTTSYTYDAKGNRIATTDALGNVTRSSFNSLGQLTSTTDALGHTTSYTYDANGNQLTQTTTRSVTGSSGTLAAAGGTVVLVTTRVYDEQDRLIKTTDPDGTSTQSVYNDLGQQVATIDKLGHQTRQEYDARGNLVKTTYPDGTTELTGYDADGRRATSTDRAGAVTSYTYDAVGRLVKTTFPDGTSTQTGFDAAGRVVSNKDAAGSITSYGYDAAGRRVSVTDALGNTSFYGYDANGNQVTFKDALGRITTTVYDALNRKVATVFADGTQASTAYDTLGRRVSETDQNGNSKAFGYDALGRLTSVTQPAVSGVEPVTRYTYDELGNQLTQTDANNHTTSYAYDSLGRRTSRTLPMGMSESLTYDAAGNLQARTDFNGTVTQFTYDTMNRLLTRTVQSTAPGIQPATVFFTYNARGQRATMDDPTGTTEYDYDARGRLIKKTMEMGALSYTYDANGNVASMVSANANGASVSYTYDALNRLLQVNDAHLGTTTYRYDAVGNLAGFTTPNAVTQSYAYNTLNRLTGVEAAVPAALTGSNGTSGSGSKTTLASYTYTLAPGGQRLSATEASGRKATYAYDALSRLTSETITGDTNGHNGTIAYTLDNVGNRLTRASTVSGIPNQSLSYDANDRVTTDQYDANGNTVVGAAVSAAQGSLTGADTYDSENRLTSRAGTLNIFYDGDGNKVRESVNGQTVNYIIDDLNPTGYSQVVEELVGGRVARTYTYGHSLISQDQLDTNGTAWHANFYGFDGHGNVRFLTNETGILTDRYDYDAFGTLLTNPGPTFNRYLYCGEQFDASLGLYNLRARLMNPMTGRFWNMDSYEGLSADPASLHKYLYANGNPVTRFDPTGHMGLLDQIGGMAIRTMAWASGATVGATAFRAAVGALNVIAFVSDPGAYLSLGPVGETAEAIGESAYGIWRGAQNLFRSARIALAAGNKLGALDALRSDLTIPGRMTDDGKKVTMAALEFDNGFYPGLEFTGNSPYRSSLVDSLKGVSEAGKVRPNIVTPSHAEGAVFNQAAAAGASSEFATLYVDRDLCSYCSRIDGVPWLARQLGIKKLTIVTPNGTTEMLFDSTAVGAGPINPYEFVEGFLGMVGNGDQ